MRFSDHASQATLADYLHAQDVLIARRDQREWERFDHPDQLASYLGIVPSEHTTGQQRRLGSITKAGSTHARRLLVEAEYHYRRGPVVGEALEHRQRGHPPEMIHISWRTQRRLNARWGQLKDTRRKPDGIVAVAIARELTAYCWADRHLDPSSRPDLGSCAPARSARRSGKRSTACTPTPALRGERSLVQTLGALAERVVEALVRTGDEAVQ